MSDDLLTATKRATELVGEGVWKKLSDKARTNAIREEMRIIETEHTATIKPLTGTLAT